MKNNKVKKIKLPVYFDDSNIRVLIVPYDWIGEIKQKRFFWFNYNKYELENIVYTEINKKLPTMYFRRIFEEGETYE